MAHPVGKHISKEQDHELNYWLKKHDFRENEDNREALCRLIDTAKSALEMNSNEHLEHTELDSYYEEFEWLWKDDFEKK
ncbi:MULTISPECIES: hypothetical protein [unclassified Enterobacter]|uniref:hypothetical protein n=1 Tax=unclassified Enterobacter TaxID=2608935 RepID=UPI002366A60C|nr:MULTISPECIES: hypothetical protein [unclassified Enterobacter]